MNSDGIEMDSLDLDARPPEQDFGEAFANMVGDADLGGGNGRIEIDRSIPHHPVIRFLGESFDGGETDGGGSGSGPKDKTVVEAGEGIDVNVVTNTDGSSGVTTTTYIVSLEQPDEQPKDEQPRIVNTVNKQDGDLSVIGGKGIRVETDGKTIKITADEDKDEEDPDPNDPDAEDGCGHPDLGYSPSSEEEKRWGGGGGGGGGYNPNGDTDEHTADPCNHDC